VRHKRSAQKKLSQFERSRPTTAPRPEAEVRALTEVFALNQKEWGTHTQFQHAIERIHAEFRALEQRLRAGLEQQTAHMGQVQDNLSHRLGAAASFR
jgi:hypothetical protein